MGKTPLAEVEGTILDDLMALGYVDKDGDTVTNGAEKIFAFGGNDFVFGGTGNDTISGGAGHDRL